MPVSYTHLDVYKRQVSVGGVRAFYGRYGYYGWRSGPGVLQPYAGTGTGSYFLKPKEIKGLLSVSFYLGEIEAVPALWGIPEDAMIRIGKGKV